MNKLNMMFLNEYTSLEELCNAKFGVEDGGISKYIEAMNAAGESKEKIGKWEEDYHMLSKCMHIHSVVVLRGEKLRKPQCTKQDVAWLRSFASRLEKEGDSLNRLEKYEAAQAKFQEKMQKVAPVAKAVAIACGVALALNALFGGKNNSEE